MKYRLFDSKLQDRHQEKFLTKIFEPIKIEACFVDGKFVRCMKSRHLENNPLDTEWQIVSR